MLGVDGDVGEKAAEPLPLAGSADVRVGYGSPGFEGLLFRFVALFFSPGGKGLSSSRYTRKLPKIRLGLHGTPSVHRLIPEAFSS